MALALIFLQISRTTVFPYQYSFGLVDRMEKPKQAVEVAVSE